MWCKGKKFHLSCSLLQKNRLVISWEVLACLFYSWPSTSLFYWAWLQLTTFIWKGIKACLKGQSRQFPSAFFIAVPCLISVLWRKGINTEYNRRSEVQRVASAPKPFSPLMSKSVFLEPAESWRAWSFKKCLTALIRAMVCCKNKLVLGPLSRFYFCQLAPSGLHTNKENPRKMA